MNQMIALFRNSHSWLKSGWQRRCIHDDDVGRLLKNMRTLLWVTIIQQTFSTQFSTWFLSVMLVTMLSIFSGHSVVSLPLQGSCKDEVNKMIRFDWFLPVYAALKSNYQFFVKEQAYFTWMNLMLYLSFVLVWGYYDFITVFNLRITDFQS